MSGAEASCIRTRQSLGSQLRETLDAIAAKGWLDSWSLANGTSYLVSRDGIAHTMNPGEAMRFCNSFGYDVRFGKGER